MPIITIGTITDITRMVMLRPMHPIITRMDMATHTHMAITGATRMDITEHLSLGAFVLMDGGGIGITIDRSSEHRENEKAG